MTSMDAAELIHLARRRAGLTLRALAALAGTSHSALAAYESARTIPTVATLDRIVTAAGFTVDVSLAPGRATVRGRSGPADGPECADRGAELIEALELAAMFPARHDPDPAFPVFPCR